MPSGYMPQKIYRFRSLFSVRSILISLIKNLIICGTSLTFLFRVNTVRIKIVDMSATLLFGILWLLAVTAIVTVLERWYRNRTLQKPVRRILDATEEVTKGNLKAAIEPIHKDSEQQNEFDLIIRNFNLMLKELQGMETLKTGFISNVSHEMKTPLSSISNYAVLMQMPGIGEEKRIAYAKQVAESTRRLSSMITCRKQLTFLSRSCRVFSDLSPSGKTRTLRLTRISRTGLSTGAIRDFWRLSGTT